MIESKKKININSIVYFILIFGAIFVDCPTGLYLGMIGRCWLIVFIPICFMIIIVNKKRMWINSYINSMIFLLLWMVLISIISNTVLSIDLGSVEYYGENIWLKSIKTCTYWVALIMYFISLLECTCNLTQKQLFTPFLMAYFFLFLVLLVELPQMPYAFSDFHYNAFLGEYTRVRLTATESSTTVPMIVCYGWSSLYYAFYLSKSWLLRIIVVVTLIIFTVTSGAKTLLLVYIVALLSCLWFNRKQINKRILPIFIGAFIVSLIVVPTIFGELWGRMMDDAGSTATRGVQLLAAIYHSIKYPFGNGGGAYMSSFRNALMVAYEWIRNSFIGEDLRYWEILNQIYSNTDSWSVIAGFWQLALSVGIFGGIYWLYVTWKYLKKLYRNNSRGIWILKVMTICILFMWLFTNMMYNVYFMWAIIFILGLKQFKPLKYNCEFAL